MRLRNLKVSQYLRLGRLVPVLLLTFSLGCASHNLVQAPTGRFQLRSGFNQYTPEQDIALGKEASKEVNRAMPVLPESNELTRYIQRLGQQLASHAPGNTNWPFSFHVVNVKEINAFALPGGPVYINVGTIRAADDEGQLAGVLAHEISHIVLRHSTQQASKASLAQLPLAVLGAAVGQSAAGQAAQIGGALATQGVLLKYSREAETEADLLGAQIMYDSGYDPYSLVEFFTKLEKQGGPGVPQFLSDHPNPGSRVQNVRQAIRKFPKKQYRSNSGEFEQIKSRAEHMNPAASQQSGG